MEDYLKNLKIEVEVSKMNAINIDRLAQLTQKTNQFNLTTRRYNESDLLSLQSDNSIIMCINVRDKFGEQGITGLTIINVEKKVASIDTFLLSCRILGKGIENEFLMYILAELKKMGFEKVKGLYIKSKKNIQTKDFYLNNRFKIVKNNEDSCFYEMSLKNYNYNPSQIIKINYNE